MEQEQEQIIRKLWVALCHKHEKDGQVETTDAAVELASMIIKTYEKKFEGLSLEKKSQIYLGD